LFEREEMRNNPMKATSDEEEKAGRQGGSYK
jgi:hypothetical protein